MNDYCENARIRVICHIARAGNKTKFAGGMADEEIPSHFWEQQFDADQIALRSFQESDLPSTNACSIALIHNEGPNLDQCKRRAPAEGHQAGQFRASLGGVDELHNFAVAAPVGLLKVIGGAFSKSRSIATPA